MTYGPKVRLTLQKFTATKDRIGSRTTVWVDERRIKGSLVDLTGDERLSDDKLTVIKTHKFIINVPLELDLNEKKQFVLGTRTFKIVFIRNPLALGRHYEVDLYEEI